MTKRKFSNKRIFYVYVWLDPRKPGPFYYGHWKFEYEPYYVGKGKNKRAWNHIGNKHAANKTNKILKEGLERIVVLKRSFLTENEALELEVRLISKIGRKDLKTGPLTNWHTSGSDIRIKHKTHHSKACSKAQNKRYENIEEREKIAQSVKNWVKNNKEKHKQYVEKRNKIVKSEECRTKVSEGVKLWIKNNPDKVKMYKKKQIKAIRKNSNRIQISRALGGTAIEVYDYETGKYITTYDTLSEAARELNVRNIWSVLSGSRNHTGGYTFLRAT